ncbi:hypothetical protein [Mesoterricola silvestris]|uniref:Uncharacterized protein n=1 Tax=Mesoterricola silvestris TaxID=2927979 RepID=A0AA48GQC8_9BACT|nr:hypothetical protein [Mesoterricola silvestris]BDU73780.1 hypothetical protein METEAL_29540 [Mesoterricola silvestris]
MSTEPTPKPQPSWLLGSIAALLLLQVGLLWMQGSMLERQYGTLTGLRQDMQDLTESLDNFQGNFDQGATDGTLSPSSRRVRPRRGVQRVRLQEQDGDQGVRKEMEDQRKSEREAVEKARDAQAKLSIAENYRKAEEKKRLEAEQNKWRPFIWGGVVLALLALILRAWLRNR